MVKNYMYSIISNIEIRLEFMSKKIIIPLFIICSISLLLRIFYFPSDIPLTLDAVGYFWYAIETNILGHFPSEYPFPNTGWPMFLSLFFGIINSNNFMDYMMVQRVLTIGISVVTIIPVYFLCKKFFKKSIALIGTILFAFEPHLIQHSMLGITDTLYIFLIIISFLLLISKNDKLIYVSFGIAALSAIVRYEGMLYLIVLSIMFFILFKKERKSIPKFLIAITIYILVLIPILYLRIQTTGDDGLTSHVLGGAIATTVIASGQSDISPNLTQFLSNGLQNLIMYTGWIMIPYFVILAPIGVILGLKRKNPQYFGIILSIIILAIPALYAYSRDIQETRYLLVLMPFFSILSLFTINFVLNKTNRNKLFIILLITSIVLSSVIFLELKKVDLDHEREADAIAQEVAKLTKVTNVYLPESKYLKTASIGNNFPVTRSNSIPETITLNTNYLSMVDFIKNNEKNNLTHIVVDNDHESKILKDLFLNDKKYPYLIKVFDSLEHEFKYHVKIYKIDYKEFIKNLNE